MKILSNTNSESHGMNEARKPKKSLKQRCIECHAVPFDDFKKEWMRQLNNRLRMYGKL